LRSKCLVIVDTLYLGL